MPKNAEIFDNSSNKLYHVRLMSNIIIPAFDFAYQQLEQKGEIPLADLLRVSESVLKAEGSVFYSLRGFLDAQHRPCLNVQLQTRLQVQCQRCLQSMALAVSVQVHLRLFKHEAQLLQAEDDDETLDGICVPDEFWAFTPWLEDEILLAIPYAPRHESCEKPRLTALKSEEKPHPFAVLSQLKRQ